MNYSLMSKSIDKNRWKSSSTSLYNLGYHIIWCTKYRRKLLTEDIQNRLKLLITEKCIELEVELCKMEIMVEHVHIFIKAKPTLAPHYILKQIKGYSAKVLRDEFTTLKKKVPCLWTRSYFIESVGVINENTIIKYIENQKGK